MTEITLNHEFLMSSLHTHSERALADVSLAQLSGDRLHVLVGGLGLGYTAQAALASPDVASVVVVEFLPQVIQWMHDGLVPLSAELNAEPRLSVVEGDIYARLLSAPVDAAFDAILIDVDHSPEDPLDEPNTAIYTPEGLATAVQHLQPGGVIGFWSYEEHSPTHFLKILKIIPSHERHRLLVLRGTFPHAGCDATIPDGCFRSSRALLQSSCTRRVC